MSVSVRNGIDIGSSSYKLWKAWDLALSAITEFPGKRKVFTNKKNNLKRLKVTCKVQFIILIM